VKTMSSSVVRSPLRHLDLSAISQAARVEARSRENHLPPVSVFRWWARRTESVVGAVVDAANLDRPGRLVIADPFAGGGTIAFAAAQRGHTVYAQDVNPWAVAGLSAAMTLPSAHKLEQARSAIEVQASALLQGAYESDGSVAVRTIRVAIGTCPGCAATLRLFPTGLVSLSRRLDAGGTFGWVACPAGHISRGQIGKRTRCRDCNRLADPSQRFTQRKTVRCFQCRTVQPFGALQNRRWEVVMVDAVDGGHRVIRPATTSERAIADSPQWRPKSVLGAIPTGDETSRLLRAGILTWEDLYPNRQRFVIEQLLELASEEANGDEVLGRALEMAIIGTSEFAGYASRWDSRYLKPYETVANHRYEETTLSVEPHVWGFGGLGRGTVSARMDALIRASKWNDLNMPARSTSVRQSSRRVRLGADTTIVCGPSQKIGAPARTFDLVLTDPPYHDDVQYAELSWLFQAWVGNVAHLDGDVTVGKAGCAAADYRSGLEEIFREIRRTMKSDGHLILSYANRHPDAWVSLVGALHDAGFRACGFAAVHSENESDHSKRGRRATTLDLLIDVVPLGDAPVESYQPPIVGLSHQDRFLRVVGGWVLEVGSLVEGWEGRMRNELAGMAYLAPTEAA